MSNIDTNIENYTITDLIDVYKQLSAYHNLSEFDVLSITNIESITNNLISKYTNNSQLRNFFIQIKSKLISYVEEQNSLVTHTITYNKKVYINSLLRKNITPGDSDSTNFTFNLDQTLKNVTNLKLDSTIIPFTWYNIEENINNNYFFVIDTSNPTNKIIITIQDGRYNKSNLLEKINDEIIINNIDLSFNLDSISNKVTISNDSNLTSYNILFHDENNLIDRNLGTILGFIDTSYNVSNSSSIVAENILNLNIHEYFFIILEDYTNFKNSSELVSISTSMGSISVPNYFSNDLQVVEATNNIPTYNRGIGPRLTTLAQNYTINEILESNSNSLSNMKTRIGSFKDILAIIPISTDGLSFGEDNINFTNDVDFSRSYFGKVDIQKMNIKLIDDYGSLVNLNGANWSTILNTTHNNL